MITPGTYRHYKGQLYDVLGVGRNSETEEEVVIYRPLYPPEVAFWVRPLAMFEETVMVDGEAHLRFEKIDQPLSPEEYNTIHE